MRLCENLLHVVDHAFHRELARREVHRHADILVSHVDPFLSLLAGHAQNKRPHRNDEASLFGQRDEFSRRNDPLLRIVPAHQRLEADNRVVRANIHDRLVHQHEFLELDGAADLVFEAVELHRLLADASRHELDTAVIHALLEVTENRIRTRKDILDAVGIRIHDHRHRDADEQVAAVELDRGLHLVVQLLDRREKPRLLVREIDIVQDNRKDIGADSRHSVFFLAESLDTFRDNPQDVIPEIHRIGSIDGAEAVDIEQDNRQRAVVPERSRFHVRLELLEEELAIVNASQGVLVHIEVVLAFHRHPVHRGADKPDDAYRSVLGIHLRAARDNHLVVSVC